MHDRGSGTEGIWIPTSGKNVMVIPFVVPKISGGVGTTPDAIELSEKADAINR